MKNSNNQKPEYDKENRLGYSILTGSVTLCVNILLASAKLFAGIISNSICITAEAINNFSDAGSSAVTLAGFKIASRPADDKHPFGHGRYEYIAAMIVSLLVLLFGFDLLKTSITRMFVPSELIYSKLSVIILFISILLKLTLAIFNSRLSHKIGSPALSAVATDSLADCVQTSATILSLLLYHFFKINIDAYLGAAVAVMIVAAGIKIFKKTLDPILGQPIDKKTAYMLRDEIMSYAPITGVHDLIIHSYGPSNIFAVVHAELPDNYGFLPVHDLIDTIEREVRRKYNIELTIHPDPVNVDDILTCEMKKLTADILNNIDPNLTFHDFRLINSPIHTNFIFDVVVPENSLYSCDEIVHVIAEEFQKRNKKFFAVVTAERSFIE